MALDGTVYGTGKPSSEWRFHVDILSARPEVHAVVHTHSTYATTLACMRLPIPPLHYMIALAGGDDIRCADYALFGSQALSDQVLEALQERKACLLANHGVIALGDNLDQALAIAFEVEHLAELYVRCLQLGQPSLLNSGQMQAVHEKFAGYGQWRHSLAKTTEH
jgi:L-fuculose-phosphate aldolase